MSNKNPTANGGSKPRFFSKERFDIVGMLKDLPFDIIGCFLYGLGVVTFAEAADFAPGGVTGLAMFVKHYTGLDIGLVTVLINIPIILICFKALGFKFFLRSVKTILVSAVIIDYLVPLIPRYNSNPLLAALFGGILAGAGLAIIYMRDSSTGGSDFVILALRKKNPQLSVGTISLAVDGVIILLNMIAKKNVDAVLYGLIMTITYSLIIDKIMYGNDARKLLTIITTEGSAISNRIMSEIDRGVTIISGKGAYTGADKNVLMCACNKSEVFKVKRLAHEVDDKAFVMVSNIDAAYGEGFKSHDD